MMKRKFVLPVMLLGVLMASFINYENELYADQNGQAAAMNRRIINPWTWQDTRGFVQGNEVTNAHRILFTAGIVSVDGDGNLLHGSDMEKQITQVLDNMEVLLEQADLTLSDVVRFTYFTTDVQAFTQAASQVLIDRLQKANCKPATSLIGVASLFHPDAVVEIEAIVVQ